MVCAHNLRGLKCPLTPNPLQHGTQICKCARPVSKRGVSKQSVRSYDFTGRAALRDLMRSEDIWFECFNRRATPMSMWDCDGKCTAAWARPLAPHLDREIALFSRFPFTGLGHKGVPDLDNFVAYHFCLAMLATFSRPWGSSF